MSKISKIPSNAKRVFKGVIFDVYQWEQEMYDGSKETFEALKRPNTVQVIATVGDQILVIEQSQPNIEKTFVSFPGGRCEENETVLESAKRELLEETGFASNDWELWQEDNPVTKMEWTVYTYIARDAKKVEEPNLDSGEKISSSLIDFEEFLSLSEKPEFFKRELGGVFLKARLIPEEEEKLQKLLFNK